MDEGDGYHSDLSKHIEKVQNEFENSKTPDPITEIREHEAKNLSTADLNHTATNQDRNASNLKE